jgi:AcrR family transcriptional regulator
MGARRQRKAELLEAAELLFADRGYHGATMRDITSAASVPLGLATYHFRSKQKLYEAVLRRREPELIAALGDSLATLLDRSCTPSVEELVEAYVSPHVRLVQADKGWRNYIRILHQLAGRDDRRDLGALLFGPFQEMRERFLTVFVRSLPSVDPERLRVALIFVRMVQVSFMAEGLSGSASSDSDRLSYEMLPALVRFCAAGFLNAVGPLED